MKLEEIIKGINVVEILGNKNLEISNIHIDSRKVEPGHLFVAVKGTQTDGHAYIEKAIEKGASAIVCETLPENIHNDITYIKVNDTEDCVGKLATVFYGDPTSKLELIGVTGTNGKTTIALFVLMTNLTRWHTLSWNSGLKCVSKWKMLCSSVFRRLCPTSKRSSSSRVLLNCVCCGKIWIFNQMLLFL